MTIKKQFARLSSPLPQWEGQGMGLLLAGLLLMLGSASLMAQDTDPFGEVNYRKYANNMSLTAYVRMGGQVLGKETVVAAFCGDELRGKDSPMDDGNYTNILYLDIYGDTKGEKLYFKVFTGGYVIEIDQGLTYTSDDIIGSTDEPYYIDVPAPVVTTPTTEGWATTCLSFNAQVPEGVNVWNVTGIENYKLVMSKATGSILPKDVPVLLYSEGKDGYVWLSCLADADVTVTGGILVGTTEATPVDAYSVMTLGHSNETGEIGFWLFSDTTVPANRAYIKDFPAGTRGFAFPDAGTTGLREPCQSHQPSEVYTLDGRRLLNSPLRKGIYVCQGKKIVMTR